MKLVIQNKKQFISNILGAASSISDRATLRVEKDKISTILASNDQTLVLYAELLSSAESEARLNVPDLKKFIRVLDSVDCEEALEVTLESNNIKYATSAYKFKYHLLDDGIIREPLINIKKIGELKFDTTFIAEEESLNKVLKASAFTTETNKLYIFCEGGKVHTELGDKTRHNSDYFQSILAETFDGETISKPLPLNFETFRLINFSKCGSFKVSINNKLGIMRIDIDKGESKLIYIVSALIS